MTPKASLRSNGSPAGGVEAICLHCGLPVPHSRREVASEFCCDACDQVYHLLLDEGFGEYYDLAAGQARGPATGTSFAPQERDRVWDDAEFQRLHSSESNEGRSIRMVVLGMYCSACVWLIEKGLARIRGVRSARVDFSRGIVTVVWQQEEVPLSAVIHRIHQLGYDTAPYRVGESSRLQQTLERGLLLRLGVAAAVAGNVMLFAIPAYFGAFSGIEEQYSALFRWVSLLLTLPAATFAAWPFHRAALIGLKERTLSIDLPVSMGIIFTYAGSVRATVLGLDHVYFDSVAMLVFLLLVSRVVVASGTRRARQAADALLSLGINSARVLRHGGWQEVPLEELLVGDLTEVRPGDTVPVDGTVVEGLGEVNEAILTGESFPVRVYPGTAVYAGSHNGSSALVLRAERVGEATRMAEIARLAQQASRGKARIQSVTDRLAGWFVLVVFSTIAISSLYWWHTDPSQIVPVALSLAVILCPCALALGTPFALAAALGRAARRGLMIKSPLALEQLAAVRFVVLDKTGTMTLGKPEVSDWILRDSGYSLDSLRSFVAAVESQSRHPLARALCASIAQPWSTATAVEEIPGRGIRGKVHDANSEYEVEILRSVSTDGVEVWVNGTVAGEFHWSDPIRPEAAEFVRTLRNFGLQVHLCSGDQDRRVEAVALQTGISHWRGHMMPEDKLRYVEELQQQGSVLMVGDGTNDVAALAQAEVGFAVSGGAQVALATGDLYAIQPGLNIVEYAFYEARRSMRIVYRNLILSLLYNLGGGLAAAAGLVSPLVAALLMPISSLTVLISSFLVRQHMRPVDSKATRKSHSLWKKQRSLSFR